MEGRKQGFGEGREESRALVEGGKKAGLWWRLRLSLAGAATTIILFAATSILLSRQRRLCRDKKNCRDKHTCVATKDVFCCDKHYCLSRPKLYLWQLPPMICVTEAVLRL